MDDSLLAGTVNVLDSSWLSAFNIAPYRSGDLDSAAEELPDADAILLRSVTRLDAGHLQRARRCKAVGTTSSGTDHIDVNALAAAGVVLCTGKGGNAIAVTDWVQWALHRAWSAPLSDGAAARKRAVVVGCGAVGSRVAARLSRWGCDVQLVDPPRSRAEPEFPGVSLDQALAEGADVVTLHIPLTRSGDDPTWHLLGRARLTALQGAAVLNAARGDVLDTEAAHALRSQGLLSFLAIDTFPGEPHPDPALVAAADLATAHIAGHSIEGKLRVAALPLVAMHEALGIPCTIDLDAAIASRRDAPPSIAVQGGDPVASLDAANAALKADPTRFRGCRAAHFRVEMAPADRS